MMPHCFLLKEVGNTVIHGKYYFFALLWVTLKIFKPFSHLNLQLTTSFSSILGIPFPKNFISIAKTILRRLFRVYAHVYHEHFSDVLQLGEVAHLNTSFKHFIIYVNVSMELIIYGVFQNCKYCFEPTAYIYCTFVINSSISSYFPFIFSFKIMCDVTGIQSY